MGGFKICQMEDFVKLVELAIGKEFVMELIPQWSYIILILIYLKQMMWLVNTLNW